MDVISVIVIGMVGAMFSLILKQYKPEFAIVVSVVTAIIIFINILGWVIPVITEIKRLMDKAAISYQYISILFKSLGICYITQFACDICKEAGQTAVAGKLELAGRIAICVLALPLFKEVLALAEMMLGKVT